MKEISKDIFCVELFLYLKNHNILIISDIHAGYDESLNKQGILIPRRNTDDLIAKIASAVSTLRKNKMQLDFIVLNGDVVHSFSKHTSDEKYALKRIFDFLSTLAKIKVIKGNHDMILSFIVRKEIEFVDFLSIADILITHGDKIEKTGKDKRIKRIIIGHVHPSINLKSGARSEKFKCFLKGKFKGKTLFVMPSCNSLIEGSDILTEKVQSPYITNTSNFQIYLVGDQIYDFGYARNLS